jgi:hypothetical protein
MIPRHFLPIVSNAQDMHKTCTEDYPARSQTQSHDIKTTKSKISAQTLFTTINTSLQTLFPSFPLLLTQLPNFTTCSIKTINTQVLPTTTHPTNQPHTMTTITRTRYACGHTFFRFQPAASTAQSTSTRAETILLLNGQNASQPKAIRYSDGEEEVSVGTVESEEVCRDCEKKKGDRKE